MMTRLLFCSSVCIFTLCCCFHPSKKRGNNLSGIRTIGIFDSVPYFSDSAARQEDNFVFYPPKEPKLISFYKKYRFYRIPAYKDWDIMYPVNDSVLEGRTYKSDTSYYYYARRDTSPVIYRFHSLMDPVFIKLPVDSLYRKNSVYREPSIEEEKLWTVTKPAGSYSQRHVITDLYTAIPNRPENSMDTFLMIYSKNKFWDSIPFAFSYTAEARKKMKLVKFKLASNGDPGSKNLFWQRPRMFSSELKEIHPPNEKDLLNAFLAFEKFLNNQ